MDLFKKFLAVLNALNKQNVEYILIGGFAVIIHGLPRLTQDIDIIVKMTYENIDKLRKGLISVFDDQEINEISLNELNNYAVIRYGTQDGFYIDILAKVGEIANYDTIEYERIEIEGVMVKVATPESLYDLKKDTIR
jgi:hypothetical protein